MGRRRHREPVEVRVAQQRVGDLRLQVDALDLALALAVVELHADPDDDEQAD